MKPFAALVVILAVSATALHCSMPSMRKEKTDVENAGLTGNVNAVRETYGDGGYEATSYDEYGYKTEFNAYYTDEGYEDKESYKNKYDENGNRIEQHIYNASGFLTYQIFYKYDKQGNNIESTTLDSKGYQNGKRIFVYDSNGDMVERLFYGASTDLPPFEKYSYTYDSRGNQIEGNGYISSGQVTSNFTCKYDEAGNKVEQHTYYTSPNKNATGQTHWLFGYDEKGSSNKSTLLDADGNVIAITTDKLDSYGNIIEQHDTSYTQNTEGHVVYTYKYDKQGNWIERTYHNAALNSTDTIKREITYYKE